MAILVLEASRRFLVLCGTPAPSQNRNTRRWALHMANVIPKSMQWVLMALLAAPAFSQVSVLTQHNDSTRTGANLQETTLTVSNVNNQHFGKLASGPAPKSGVIFVAAKSKSGNTYTLLRAEPCRRHEDREHSHRRRGQRQGHGSNRLRNECDNQLQSAP
jgi:hypothetical protein